MLLPLKMNVYTVTHAYYCTVTHNIILLFCTAASSNVGAAVGGAVVAVILLVLIVVGIVLAVRLWRKR